MFLLFMAVWLILNGRATVEIILFGLVISAALFYFMCRYMGYNSRKELLLFRFSCRYLHIPILHIFLQKFPDQKLPPFTLIHP